MLTSFHAFPALYQTVRREVGAEKTKAHVLTEWALKDKYCLFLVFWCR